MPRAERGIGAFATAVEGHWNSRMTGSVGSGAARRGTSARLSEDFAIALLPRGQLPDRTAFGGFGGVLPGVLLVPEMAVDDTALEQNLVRRHVEQAALVHHDDLVAID